jgi:hypothetical protein
MNAWMGIKKDEDLPASEMPFFVSFDFDFLCFFIFYLFLEMSSITSDETDGLTNVAYSGIPLTSWRKMSEAGIA